MWCGDKKPRTYLTQAVEILFQIVRNILFFILKYTDDITIKLYICIDNIAVGPCAEVCGDEKKNIQIITYT